MKSADDLKVSLNGRQQINFAKLIRIEGALVTLGALVQIVADQMFFQVPTQFTTGNALVTEGPSLLVVSPAAGAVDVVLAVQPY